jgi:hypothetical protein
VSVTNVPEALAAAVAADGDGIVGAKAMGWPSVLCNTTPLPFVTVTERV